MGGYLAQPLVPLDTPLTNIRIAASRYEIHIQFQLSENVCPGRWQVMGTL